MAPDFIKQFFVQLRRIGTMLEDGLLIFFLTTMILLACSQIALRNLFGMGFVWADGLLQISVLWIGLLGAMAASRDDNHINIDVLTRFFPQRWRFLFRLVSHFFTAAICGMIAWESFLFVRSEYTYGTSGVGNCPLWVFQSILPLGFGLIAYRYILNFFLCLRGFRDERDSV